MTQRRELNLGNLRWIDICSFQERDLFALAKEFNLPQHLVRDCMDPEHLPKIARAEAYSFLVLRTFDENSSSECTSIQEISRKIAIFMKENLILTLHRSSLAWLDLQWQSWERQSSVATAPAIITELIEECIYSFDDPIDQSALEMEKLEDQIFQSTHMGSTPREMLEHAYLLKKRATLFKRLLRLTRDLIPFISKLGDQNSPAVQGLKGEADRLYFYADDLVETSNDLTQLSISLTSDRTNQVIRVLTIVSIFLMPLNLVVGVYGMNFRFMPELEWPWGYPAALLFMLALTGSIYLLLRNKGWIHSSKKKNS